jgi:hypothetical protein
MMLPGRCDPRHNRVITISLTAASIIHHRCGSSSRGVRAIEASSVAAMTQSRAEKEAARDAANHFRVVK